MRRRTYDVVGRAEGRRLLETQGTHSDLAAAFLWIARTICISQESFYDFFLSGAAGAVCTTINSNGPRLVQPLVSTVCKAPLPCCGLRTHEAIMLSTPCGE